MSYTKINENLMVYDKPRTNPCTKHQAFESKYVPLIDENENFELKRSFQPSGTESNRRPSPRTSSKDASNMTKITFKEPEPMISDAGWKTIKKIFSHIPVFGTYYGIKDAMKAWNVREEKPANGWKIFKIVSEILSLKVIYSAAVGLDACFDSCSKCMDEESERHNSQYRWNPTGPNRQITDNTPYGQPHITQGPYGQHITYGQNTYSQNEYCQGTFGTNIYDL